MLIEKDPADVEARAGLVDVLLWDGRWSMARVEIDAALGIAPNAAELWVRRARLQQWTGERTRAVESADRAETLAPGDEEIRQFRDQLFVTEARASARVDAALSRPYPILYTAVLQASSHWSKFELGVEARTRAWKYPAVSGVTVDGLYLGSAAYHTDSGAAFGLALGFGAPGASVPRFQSKAWFATPIGARWSMTLSYSFWRYADGKIVHIVAPSLGYAINSAWFAEVGSWASCLVPSAESGTAGMSATSMSPGCAVAAGARSTWRVTPESMFGASYAYGPQLDQVPTRSELLHITSHIFAAFADFRLTRQWGLQPMLGFERRKSETATAVPIYAAEIAAYFRH